MSSGSIYGPASSIRAHNTQNNTKIYKNPVVQLGTLAAGVYVADKFIKAKKGTTPKQGFFNDKVLTPIKNYIENTPKVKSSVEFLKDVPNKGKSWFKGLSPKLKLLTIAGTALIGLTALVNTKPGNSKNKSGHGGEENYSLSPGNRHFMGQVQNIDSGMGGTAAALELMKATKG